MAESNSNLKDGILSVIITILISLIYLVSPDFFKNLNLLSNIEIFVTILVSFIGFILTILAILYTFETELKKNKIIKVLIQKNLFKDFYNLFTNSLKGLSLVLLILIIIFIIGKGINFTDNIIIIEDINFSYGTILSLSNLFILFCLIFAGIKTYNFFSIFFLLQDTMRNREKKQKEKDGYNF